MYKIMLKNASGTFKLATCEKEKTKVVIDEDTNEEEVVGTGQYETVNWESDSESDLEEKCIELMKKYPSEYILPIKDMTFEIDLIFS